MLRRQLLERPARRVTRDGVEPLGLIDAAGHFVVVAAHDRRRLECLHALDDGVGVGAVADEIAEHEGLLVAAGAGVVETGGERFQVRVDVGQNEITHGASVVLSYGRSQSTNCSTRAGSRWAKTTSGDSVF